MKANVLGCLAAFILGCNVTAGTSLVSIIHQIVEEKTSVTLPCLHAVDHKVTWSREKDGRKVDILRIDGDRDTRHDRRYNTVGGKSLYINRVTVSDSGRYFCNEAAVELTVIPSGTNRSNAVLKTSVRLKCFPDVAGSDVPMWTRESQGSNVTVFSQTEENASRFQYSTEEKTLIISNVQLDDAGLYYCGGKPSTFLTVIEDEQPQKVPVLVLAVVLPILLFVIFILLFLTWRCSIRRRRSREQRTEVVYSEIPDEPTQGGSNQCDVTYSVIQNLPESKTTTARSQPNKMLYSLINHAA